jgi:hypothetical protein
MKTILEITSGKVLFVALEGYELQDNQTAIDLLLTEEFVNPYYDFATLSFYEGATTQEINDIKIPQALEIDLYYTGLISDLLRKHIEKLSIDGIPIPQDAINERDRLRAECNQKIMDLGIINFSYRQSNLKL